MKSESDICRSFRYIWLNRRFKTSETGRFIAYYILLYKNTKIDAKFTASQNLYLVFIFVPIKLWTPDFKDCFKNSCAMKQKTRANDTVITKTCMQKTQKIRLIDLSRPLSSKIGRRFWRWTKKLSLRFTINGLFIVLEMIKFEKQSYGWKLN